MRSVGSRPRRPSRRAATLPALPALLALAALFGGCGGDMSRDKLQQRVDFISSIAAEGRLMAQDVLADRERTRFVRVHARELADNADKEAEDLTDGDVGRDLEAVKTRAAQVAVRVSTALRRLQVAPGDARTARVVMTQLGGDARATDGLRVPQ